MVDGSKEGRRGIFSYLRRHPVPLLLLLSPGIPEYLTSSSPFNAIVLNPVGFILQLALNLGLYGPGVLLIREAAIRWGKGWGTILSLGSAYGILEEGIAVSTMFNPASSAVSYLGTYGRWLGVNWIWVPSITIFHAAISIALPILLLKLAVPESSNRRFLSKKTIILLSAIMLVDIVLLMNMVRSTGFVMTGNLLLGSVAAIITLVILGYRLPERLLYPYNTLPTRRPIIIALMSILFFVSMVFSQSLGKQFDINPLFVDAEIFLSEGLILFGLLHSVGYTNNRKQLVAMSAGLTLPIMVLGFFGSLSLNPIADAMLALFLLKLWKS